MSNGNPFDCSFQGQQQFGSSTVGTQGGYLFGAPADPRQQPQQEEFYPPPQQPPSPYQQPMPQHGRPGIPSHEQQGYEPFSQPPLKQQSLLTLGGQHGNVLVPSEQPSNPYAGIVEQPNDAKSQYAAAPAANSFDPFAAASMPFSQVMVPLARAENSPYTGDPSPRYQQAPHPQSQRDIYGHQMHHTPSQPHPHFHSPAPSPQQQQSSYEMVHAPSNGYPDAPTSRSPPLTSEPTDNEGETPTGVEARNKYSAALAQNAPLGASPLPRADMVRKTGYVLSRISFRTIVMKKWKQSFWVQYGPHTMLWFRSQADFDDWLNNPYHTQAQRNFLIKLAVNFAHDLYKPNVRGYQVTQCRTKNYGTKLIRQFKLERWMDYGPTIAAAFGSNNPKEVDDLREALVACMRNTPLNGGIRATGAVRDKAEQVDDGQGGRHDGEERSRPDEGYDHAPYGGHPSSERPTASRSVASAGDMRHDQKGFDENDSEHSAPDLLDFSAPAVQHQPQLNSQPTYSQQSAHMQQSQFPGYLQHQQQVGTSPPQQYQGAPRHFHIQQPYGVPPHTKQKN